MLLLYNPNSGRQNFRTTAPVVAAEFEKCGARVIARELDFTENPFKSVSDIDLVVVAGGDGSVGYVVGAMRKCRVDLPLGIIPAGTANDFALMLGLPLDPIEAVHRIINAPIRAVDCGCVNGRYFVNIFSFGLFTTTSQRTVDCNKRRFGRLAYIVEGVRELRSVRSLPLSIVTDGERLDAEVVTALIFNGQTAGRIPLARGARCDDGVLDGVFLLKSGRLSLLFDIVRYLCGGRARTVVRMQGSRFTITSSTSDILTDVDGQRGPDFPLEIECCSRKVKLKG